MSVGPGAKCLSLRSGCNVTWRIRRHVWTTEGPRRRAEALSLARSDQRGGETSVAAAERRPEQQGRDWRKAMAKFRMQRLRGGRKHVLTTDSPADYLRCLIDEMAGDFSVLCHVTITERPRTDWMRVEIASAPEAARVDRASEFRFGEFSDELNHIFIKFYVCDPSAVASLHDTTSRIWTVRHRAGCPWI